MGGIEYVYWQGARLTPWMLYCLLRLDADLRRLFRVHLVLDSSKGIRLNSEQRTIFLDRYRLQSSGKGPFGDVRWFEGRRYVRHSGLGTVAPPGESNHEIQGDTGAVDLADSGGAGIGTMGSERSNWLRANAANYGLIPEGFEFKEAWHYAVPGIFRTPPSDFAPTPTPAPLLEDDDMLMLNITGLGIATPKVTLAPGVFGHFLPSDPVERVKNISRAQDDWQDITAAELPAFLRLYGCDLRIWDVRGGQFVVLDSVTGEVGPGKTWTAAGAVRAAITGITAPEIDPTPIVKAVRDAIAEGIDVTAEEFADVLARRLAD